jgi:NAD+ synthase
MIRNCEELLPYLYEEIRRHTDVAVVGMSGGADSSLVSVLCCQALGRDNVYGVSMPYNERDVAEFNAVSARLAQRLRIHHLVRPVTAIADAITERVFLHAASEITPLNAGNSRSRARMCVLYGLAHNLAGLLPGRRVRVVGTGNLSEDFIGYDTKGGDALADFFPVGQLFKSEVYQLLDHFRDRGVIREEDIDRVPSAGLAPGQTDEGDLGYSYDAMERSVRYCMEQADDIEEGDLDEITAFVWQRHEAHRHKHEASVVVRLRHLCD